MVEPRTTLLDALRNRLDITGAKSLRLPPAALHGDRDGRTIYACTALAIDSQGSKITTIRARHAR
jgi:xanthine dehydrogenase YagT iron-sulfur-binding subunit